MHVPTTKPRHVITETDDVARLLDEAEKIWPQDRGNRKRLLLHLAYEGLRAAQRDQQAARESRQRVLDETAGLLTGAYPEGYLDELHREWPG